MSPARASEPGGPWRPGAAVALHLAALSGFAVAQPLFDVLRSEATFFVARRSEPSDLLTLVLILTALVPALMWTCVRLASLLHEGLARGLHLAIVGLLVALLLAAPVKALGGLPDLALAGLCTIGGAVFALGYRRSEALRTFLSAAAFAPLLFGVLFLFRPPVSALMFAKEAPSQRALEPLETSGGNLVVLVLDEFPLASLLDGDRHIDARLFPNFARLASHSTWYRNATSTHFVTRYAVMSLLTGRRPVNKLATLENFPDNLFTLLGTSHRMTAHESSTRLCPREFDEVLVWREPWSQRMASLVDDLVWVYGHIVLPDGVRQHLPPVDQNWSHFRDPDRRGTRFEEPRLEEGQTIQPKRHDHRQFIVHEFIEGLGSATDPTLHYLHVLLPHKPWTLTHDGRRYGISLVDGHGNWPKGMGSDAIIDLAYRRHLLQVGYTDAVLGRMIDRMERAGVYDDTTFVVVGDHGMSFQVHEDRRVPRKDNVRNVLHVPLFIKQPQQKRGRLSDRNVEGIDVLPTIAEIMDIEIPWAVEGVSALSDDSPARSTKTAGLPEKNWIVIEDVSFPQTWPDLEYKRRLVGTEPTWEDVYSRDASGVFIGTSVDAHATGLLLPLDIELYMGDRYEAVDLTSHRIPAYVEGQVRARTDDGLTNELAVAVNGVIRSLATSYDRSGDSAAFAALVPVSAFQNGRNAIEVFAIRRGAE